MPFQNPTMGGEVLVRNAMQSENYAPGSAGWRIERLGAAELSQLVARGTITAGQGLGVYNPDGSFVRMDIVTGIGAAFETNPPDFGGVTYLPGSVYSQQVGASSQPQLVVQSPNIQTPSVRLPAQIILQGQGAGGGASHIDLSADGFSLKGQFGIPLYQDGAASVAVGAADTSKDTAVITLPIAWTTTSNIAARLSNTSAASYGWHIRPISVTATTFVIRCMGPAPGGAGFTAGIVYSAFGF